MAPTVNWRTQVVTVLQSDTDILTLVSGTVYSFDTLAFRLGLHALQESEEGILWDDIFLHKDETTISGTTYVRFIEMINGYSLVLLPDTLWSALMDGASNNNFHDVAAGVLVQNSVQVIPSNSAGNTITETGVSGLTAAEALSLADQEAILRNRREIDPVTGIEMVYESDGVTPRFTRQLFEDEAGLQVYRRQGVERSQRFEP